MWFWWFILICDCLIPAIMIIAGRMMWKHCPKKINGVVGYNRNIKHYYHCNTTGIFNRLYFPNGKVIKKQFQ